MAFEFGVSNYTELLHRSSERVREHYENISKKLNTWNDYIGHYGDGMPFDGATVDVFWAGLGLSGGKVKAVKPAIKEAVKEVLEATIKDCREYSLEPKDYFREAEMLLESLVRSILKDMIKMDWYFGGKGYPDRVQPLSEDHARGRFGADQLERFIHEQAEATAFLASPKEHRELEIKPEAKGGIPAEEVNIEVRRILRGNPSWDWKARELTEEVKKNLGGGSLGAVGSCPAWKAYHERRKQLRKKKTINTVSISKGFEAVLGTENEQVQELIVEGEEMDRNDARQAKLYLSHEKKPRGRES